MKRMTVVLLLFVLILAACGGDDTADPTEAPTEAQPTAAEAVEVDPTAVPSTVAPPTEAPAAEETPTVEPAAESESIVAGREHTADPQLVNITWEWIQRDPNGNDIEAIAVPEPEKYTLLFNADGTFSAQIDCNTVFGEYATTPPNTIFMQLGPSTMVACEETSLAPEMSQMFGPAQSYRFEEDGAVLVFSWAAGGPVDYYRDASVEAPGTAEVEGIPEDAIQMDLQGLATSYAWTVQPGNPIPPGPGGQGFPPHILLTFDDATPEEVMANRGARMYIFPTQAYVNMYIAADNTIVADQVARLEELIATAADRTTLPESPMPLLPPPSTYMDRWVQFLDLNFGVGEGVRYVSDASNRQQIGPWTNETTDYYYQGMTSDGVFYVSLFWPVATESLPNTYDDVPQDAVDASQNPETNAAYQQDIKDTLNALPASAWVPDLSRLDAMVASLTFPTGSDTTEVDDTDKEVDLPEPDTGEPTAVVTAPDGIFIRTGPGTDYPSIGAAPFEETGEIVGVSEDGEWWVVALPEAPNEQGWISAAFVEATNAGDVPVIPTPPLEPALTGTTWQWVSLTNPNGVTVVNDPASYTILFNTDGTANIQADCNSVGATYTTADSSSINIVLGPSTLVACPDGSLDQQFLTGLSNAAIYFFEEGDLYMDMQADGGTLRFEAQTTDGTEGSPPAGVADGSQFVVVSFGPVGAEQPVLAGTQITATFEDTEVFGSAGCNDYAGTLTPVNDYFTVGPIISTQKACADPAGIMEQEQAYLTALQGTNGYSWEEQRINNTTVVTAGQLSYVLADGTAGVINYISP